MIKKDVKNVFAAIKEHPDRIIHIASVDRSCDRGDTGKFVCPRCNCSMGAKLGNHNQWHFYHIVKTNECDANLVNETALHKLAKNILEVSKSIRIPQYAIDAQKDANRNRSDPNQNEPYVGMNEMDFEYTDIKVESNMGGVIPDVILSDGKMNLCVEIAVTHYVDDEKRKKIKEKNLSTIEIDISNFANSDVFDQKELETYLLNNTKGKEWIYHRKEGFFLEKLKERNRNYEKEYLELQKTIGNISKPLKKGNKPYRYESSHINKDERTFFENMSWYKESIKLYGCIPPYCDIVLKNEYAFTCSRSIWQMMIFNVFVINNTENNFSASDIYIYFQKKYSNILNLDEMIIPNSYVDPQPDNLLGRAIMEYLGILVDYSFLSKVTDENIYSEFNILKRTL